MKKLFTFLLLLGSKICYSQNLVPNPGFESYDSLPCDFISDAVQFDNMLHYWTVPNLTTPDLCSPLISATCDYGNPFSPGSAGTQVPRTGNMMIGMVCENGGYNEYLQVPLITPLVIGNSYRAEMYVSLAAKSDFANNGIGMYFSEMLIADPNFESTDYIPQILDTTVITDTLNWVLISGCFTATTAAQYLIIGNFISSCSHGTFMGGGWPMAYYFFDDVFLTQIPSCSSVPLNCTTGVSENKNSRLKIYPNPALDFITIENGTPGATMDIVNMFGTLLLSQKIIPVKTQFNLQVLPQGIYTVRYTAGTEHQTWKLVKR